MAADETLELTNVAGPGIFKARFHGSPGKGTRATAQLEGKDLDEVIDKKRNIFAALAQGRNAQSDGVEAVIQVSAESPLFESLFNVHIGCGDDADVHGNDAATAKPGELLVLQNVEQFGLQAGRHFADFVEKNGAVVAKLKKTWLWSCCAGEGSGFIAKELTFKKFRRQCGAIDFEEGAVGSQRTRMEGTRGEFLANTRFAEEQHRNVNRSDSLDLVLKLGHSRTVGWGQFLERRKAIRRVRRD